MLRRAFTLLELIVVIVIIGILSKFGVDLLIRMYENYVFSNVQNTLQSKSELAVMQLANRLEYRIRDSVIARSSKGGAPIPIGNAGGTYRVLEWIGIDADGWLGAPNPDWSGFIDLAASSATQLSTPGTTSIPTVLGTPAIFFVGSDVDLNSNFGWNGAITNQDASMHPVSLVSVGGSPFLTDATGVGTFAGTAAQPNDVYEYYQLARSAYAVSLEDYDGDGETDDLVLYYDYQPWNGGSMNTASSALLVDNVDTFQFRSVSDILKIQICVTTENDITGEGQYAICKEKTVF